MKAAEPIARRHFIKTFALTTVLAGSCGVGRRSMLISEASAQSAVGSGIFRADITQSPFTPLLNASNGSVRVTVSAMPDSAFDDIIITRVSASQFFAVTARCTHVGANFELVQAFSGGALLCTHQGSRFNANGTVINGPAALPLTSYPTTFDGVKYVKVEIPNLGYSIVGASVATAVGQRFAITFPTVSGIAYRVGFQESLNSTSWTPVAFATTQTGTTSANPLTGNGSNLTVYVDQGANTKGFYVILRG